LAAARKSRFGSWGYVPFLGVRQRFVSCLLFNRGGVSHAMNFNRG